MGLKLLLAEDTRDLNRALVTILEHEGYEVTATFDGVEALQSIEDEPFDGIVLDIMMPKLNGLQVLERIRTEGITTPVLLLTAKAEIDDRVTGLDAGADDYLTKPFAMKELLARVRSMTRRAAINRDNLAFGDLTLDVGTYELRAANAVRLSVKEFELMHTLMRNARHRLGTDFLLGNVWADEADAGQDTVLLYISYLSGKLNWAGSCVTVDGSPDVGWRLVMQADEASV